MLTSPRIPQSVFVAHSPKDYAFAELLLKVLGMKGINAWHAPDDELRGDRTPGIQDKGLRETESLVVVFSQAALQSDLLRAQVQAFTSGSFQGRVYVLLLDDIEQDHALLSGLESATRVDCSVSRLDGARKLTAVMTASMTSGAATDASILVEEFLSQLDRLSQINPLVHPKRPLPSAMRQRLLLDIIDSFKAPLERKFRLIDPADGEATTLPAGVLQELVLDSRSQLDGLQTWVPEFFVRTVAQRLGEAFQIEPRRQERVCPLQPTLAQPPSVQPAQVEALRKFNTLASRMSTTPVAV